MSKYKSFLFVLAAASSFILISSILKKKKTEFKVKETGNNQLNQSIDFKQPDLIIVEQSPLFPSNVMEWIVKNLHYPLEAKSNGIQGRVVVYFVVNTVGEVTNSRIIKGVEKSLDEEALRVVNSMPCWTPRTKPSTFNIPINFVFR